MTTTNPIRWPVVRCFEDAGEICECSSRERALRALAAGTLDAPMSAEQRADCLQGLGSDRTALNDRDLAKAVCAAEQMTARVDGCFDLDAIYDDLAEPTE